MPPHCPNGRMKCRHPAPLLRAAAKLATTGRSAAMLAVLNPDGTGRHCAAHRQTRVLLFDTNKCMPRATTDAGDSGILRTTDQGCGAWAAALLVMEQKGAHLVVPGVAVADASVAGGAGHRGGPGAVQGQRWEGRVVDAAALPVGQSHCCAQTPKPPLIRLGVVRHDG